MAVQDPTTKSIWCRSDRYTSGGNSRKYIVVHNTANTATAEQEAKNLHNNAGQSSFHYAIDDTDIVQQIDQVRGSLLDHFGHLFAHFHAGGGPAAEIPQRGVDDAGYDDQKEGDVEEQESFEE